MKLRLLKSKGFQHRPSWGRDLRSDESVVRGRFSLKRSCNHQPLMLTMRAEQSQGGSTGGAR